MKYFINVLIFASVAYARPNVSPAIRFADGKIIGGQEAPKRKDRFLIEKEKMLAKFVNFHKISFSIYVVKVNPTHLIRHPSKVYFYKLEMKICNLQKNPQFCTSFI